MNTSLAKLNLTPQEQRLVVAITLVVFVSLNVWFVWPRFKDLGRLKREQQRLENDLRRYQDLIEQAPVFQKELAKLDTLGVQLPSEEQALNLLDTVMKQAVVSKVNVNNYTPSRAASGQTNLFFEEQTLTINIANTGEEELVNFLYALSSGNSLIRVKSMSLQPDQPRMRLAGSITLVASYQRKTPLKPAAPTTGTPAKTNVSPARTSPATTLPGRTNKPAVSTNKPSASTNKPAAKPTTTPAKKP